MLGVIKNPEVQRMWGLRQNLGQEHRRLTQEVMHHQIDAIPLLLAPNAKHDPETCPGCRLNGQVLLVGARHELASNLFWLAVREELPPETLIKQATGSIGIRKGWKAVLVPADGPSVSRIIPAGIGIIQMPF